jgi:predicted nucleic acid-binding Zn ribbon protein
MNVDNWRRQVDRVLRTLRACDGCGLPFQAVRPGQKHCRPSCRVLAEERKRDRGHLFDGQDEAQP